MNDNELWAFIWKCAATVLCVLITVGGGCNMNRHYQTRLLIENAKIDGLSAQCAINSDSSESCRQVALRDMINRSKP